MADNPPAVSITAFLDHEAPPDLDHRARWRVEIQRPAEPDAEVFHAWSHTSLDAIQRVLEAKGGTTMLVYLEAKAEEEARR